MTFLRLLLLALALLTSLETAKAQTPSISFCQPQGLIPQAYPCPAPVSTQAGGTISVTNTFQIAAALNSTSTRSSCLLQNKGANNMYVYFKKSGGTTASVLASFLLIPGQSINCANSANQILQEEIDITGTSSDTYSLILQ